MLCTLKGMVAMDGFPMCHPSSQGIAQICWPDAVISPYQTFHIQAQSSISTGIPYAVVGPAEGLDCSA